jgi:hypothetical protein
MNIPVLKLTLISSVYALVLFTSLFWRFANAQFIWEWFIQVAATLIGTILGVAVAIGLFSYQSQKRDEAREEQLLTTLAGETQSNLNTLNGQPSVFESREGIIDCVILLRLTFLVAEEAIKSGVFSPDEARFLSELFGQLQAHNNEVDSILSRRTGLDETGVVQGEASHYEIAELKLRQGDIRKRSMDLLQDLEAAGIKVPVTPNQATSSNSISDKWL